MYHRILPVSDPRYSSEEPGMVVEPETFRLHIKLLKEKFTIMPLSEWIDRKQAGKTLPINACALTFDDGWADNYQYAFPIIQQEQVPITLFAVSDMLGSNTHFWPNQVAELLTALPLEDLQQLEWLQAHLEPATAGKLSRDHISGVIQRLKQYPDDLIQQWLEDTWKTTAHEKASEQPLVNWQQLKEMAHSGLVDVGSHTCNHYRLREDLNHPLMEKEITRSQQRLQQELDQPVDLFCYPNGDVCAAAEALVKKHYKAAVTTRHGINTTRTDNTRLLRIGLQEGSSNSQIKLQARLSGWV